MRILFALMLWMFGLGGSGWAQMVVTDALQAQVLNPSLRAWVDPNGKATVGEVDQLPDSAFVPLASRKQSPQGPHQAIWLRLDLSTEQQYRAWFLSTTQVSTDSVRLYNRKAADQPWQMQQAGTQTPVADWPLREMRPTFPIILEPGKVQRFYLRVHDVYGSWTGLQISSEKVHLEDSQQTRLLLGIYLGVSVVVLMLGLANWASSRDTLWLSYAAYNALMTLAQLSLIGLSGTLFFDRWPRINEFGVHGIIAIACVAFVLFAVQASKALRFAPTLATVSLIYAALLTLWVVCFWLARTGWMPLENVQLYETTDYLRADFMAQAIVPLSLFCGVLIALLFAVTRWRGYTFGGGALVIVLLTLASGFPQSAYSLHWIERSWLSEYAFLFGLSLESIGMLFVMQRHGRFAAHTAGRLRHVRLQDALTGLMPRDEALRNLDTFFDEAEDRAVRVDMFYVRLDNLAEIMREYGHEAADAALLLMARYLTDLCDAGDVATRMGSESFMLAPANTMGVDRSTQELREKASTLIAKGLGNHALLGQTVKLDMRIWIGRVKPGQTPAAQALAFIQQQAATLPDPTEPRRIQVIEQFR